MNMGGESIAAMFLAVSGLRLEKIAGCLPSSLIGLQPVGVSGFVPVTDYRSLRGGTFRWVGPT